MSERLNGSLQTPLFEVTVIVLARQVPPTEPHLSPKYGSLATAPTASLPLGVAHWSFQTPLILRTRPWIPSSATLKVVPICFTFLF